MNTVVTILSHQIMRRSWSRSVSKCVTQATSTAMKYIFHFFFVVCQTKETSRFLLAAATPLVASKLVNLSPRQKQAAYPSLPSPPLQSIPSLSP